MAKQGDMADMAGRGLWAAVGFLSVLALAFGPARAEDDARRLRPDPALVRGQLANGLRYAILHQASHGREVIHFRVEAGSRDEAENEQGIAHFLEHMAFNGSQHIPAESLIRTAETLGIAFGRDQNAHTHFRDTDYSLDLDNVDSRKLDFAFLWMRDVADGLLISPDEVNRERGVVLAEYLQDQGPGPTIGLARSRFLTPLLRSAWRWPIGERTRIESFDARAIRAFYQRWYRPQNVIVVAVGDEPAAAVRRRIEAAFSSWRNPTPAPPRESLGTVDVTRPAAAMAYSDPRMASGLGVCRFGPPRPRDLDDFERRRDDYAYAIWAAIFQRRTGLLARMAPPPFVSASSETGELDEAAADTCFTSAPLLDDWNAALAALVRESRRMELYGITRAEFDFAVTQLNTVADISTEASSTAPPEALAEGILRAMVQDRVYAAPAEERRIERLVVAGLDPAAIKADVARRWSAMSPPILTLVSPAPVSVSDLNAAWAADLAAPAPPPPTDRPQRPWAYGPAATPGRVVSTVQMKDPDFTRVMFENGVVLNVKSTRFDADTVHIRVSFGAGQKELPNGSSFAAGLGGQALFQGGFARNDINDVLDAFAGRECNALLDVLRDRFTLSGWTRPADLSEELQVLSGLVSEPGFRPDMDVAVATAVHTGYRQNRSNPLSAASRKLNELKPPPHIWDWVPEAQAAALTAKDFRALLEEPLTRDVMEVTIVGQVDEGRAIAQAAATFGALPPRRRGWTARPYAPLDRWPAASPLADVTHHEAATNAAGVVIVWPLYVFEPERVHEERVMNVVAGVLQDRVTERLRQALGASYSPTVSPPRGVIDDQAAMTLSVITTPQNVAGVEAEVQAMARDLAGGDISQAAFEQARQPLLDGLAKEKTYNQYWLDAIDGSYHHPDTLLFARTREADYASITLADVKAAAARWLRAPPMIVASVGTPKAVSPGTVLHRIPPPMPVVTTPPTPKLKLKPWPGG